MAKNSKGSRERCGLAWLEERGEEGKLWEGTARDRAHCPESPCQMGLGLSPLPLLAQNQDLSISVHPSIHLSLEHQLGHAANPRGTTQLGILRAKNSPASPTKTSGAAQPLPTAPLTKSTTATKPFYRYIFFFSKCLFISKYKTFLKQGNVT